MPQLLYEELSYRIRGIAIEIRREFGPGMKEIIYQNAFNEELIANKIPFKRELSIKIYSSKTKKVIGIYRPDFIIDDKIILEMKAVALIPKLFLDQLFGYLRNSEFELGFLINFSSPTLYIKRIIHTNDRKLFLHSV